MAKILIRRAHRLTLTEARDTAERLARRVQERLAVTWRWNGDALELAAPRSGLANGATGRVMLDHAEVAIEIHLPLALRPVKRFVESQLELKLDAVLGTP